MSDENVRLTREQLYELVWSKPMTTIAAEFGMSSNAFAKHVERLEVPRPSRGYWQQLAAGIKVTRDPLPKANADTPPSIAITKHERPAGLARTRVAELPEVKTSDRLVKPHAAIVQLRDALKGPGGNEYESIRGEGHAVLKTSDATRKRALLLLDALFKALDVRGHEVRLTNARWGGDRSALNVMVTGKPPVELWLIEKLDQTEHVLTDDEKLQKATYSWSFAPKYDYAHSGRLVLEIDTPWDARIRKRWADGKAQRLEDVLGEVVVGIERAAEAWEADRERKEREEQERKRAAADAEARERRAAHRRALEEDLVEMAEQWRQSRDVRDFLEAVRSAVPEPRSEPFSAWLTWAEDHAAALDPLRDRTKIAKSLDPR